MESTNFGPLLGGAPVERCYLTCVVAFDLKLFTQVLRRAIGRDHYTHFLVRACIRSIGGLVCSLKSGPLFELVPASDMELRDGQEINA